MYPKFWFSPGISHQNLISGIASHFTNVKLTAEHKVTGNSPGRKVLRSCSCLW